VFPVAFFAIIALFLSIGQIAVADAVRLDTTDGELFAVPVVVNDTMVLRFTVDTASTDVSVSEDVYLKLMRNGTLTSEDMIDTQNYRLANGTEQKSPRFRFRSLRIGNVELRGVIGSVVVQNGDLLLGQSFLSRLKSWSIDNERHVFLINESDSSQRPPVRSSVVDAGANAAGIAEPPHGSLFRQSIAYLLTGDDLGGVRLVNGAQCTVEVRHRVWPDAPELVSVIHLNNVDRALSSIQAFQDVPRNRVDITLRGNTVVDYLARPAFTHGSQKISQAPAHSASEITITLYTDDVVRVRDAWDYIYSHGCKGSDSLRSRRTAASFTRSVEPALQ
jgi:gag-polyprotein putative aspartyl protease